MYIYSAAVVVPSIMCICDFLKERNVTIFLSILCDYRVVGPCGVRWVLLASSLLRFASQHFLTANHDVLVPLQLCDENSGKFRLLLIWHGVSYVSASGRCTQTMHTAHEREEEEEEKPLRRSAKLNCCRACNPHRHSDFESDSDMLTANWKSRRTVLEVSNA